MGAWSASITGNDTAQDLLQEYSVAFWKYSVEEALEKLDAYVRETICDESDPEEWVSYYYSLADYMWKKGVLTPGVRDRAVEMIDSRFGMEVWEAEGKSVLRQREKTLAAFREKLLSPQPPKKRIKPNAHMQPIFHPGDLIAVRLQTAGKPYLLHWVKKPAPCVDFSAEEFHALDGKYVLIQSIGCFSSWSSAFDPEVKDWWAHFKLFEGIYDEPPVGIDPGVLRPVLFDNDPDHPSSALGRFYGGFYCESSMFWFKKRGCVVVGNMPVDLRLTEQVNTFPLIWGMDKPWGNADSELLCSMGQSTQASRYEGDIEPLDQLCRYAIVKVLHSAGIRGSAHHDEIRQQTNAVSESLRQAAEGGSVYVITHAKRAVAVLAVLEGQITVICTQSTAWGLGYDEQLLRYALEHEPEGLSIALPENVTIMIEMFERNGFRRVPTEEPDAVALRFGGPK